MKILICGAGQVGTSIARHLAGENNDVTVIDQDESLVRRISETLDVRGVLGKASHPNVLERAGAADVDMLIAVTQSDETNMVACQVAHSLFRVPTKIARVREQSYLNPIWADLFGRDNMPIDVIISPEREVARAIGQRLQVPGALDVVAMADGLVRLVAVHCAADCPILHTPLRQLTELFSDLSIVVVGIIRDDRGLVPRPHEQMQAGDEVYFICDTRHLARAMASFGHEEVEAHSVIIAGGGNIGLTLAADIEASHAGVSVQVIEYAPERARLVAQTLEHGIVLNGDALDPEILEEANVAGAEAFVAVSNDDEVNILGSLLAKRSGVGRTVTLINRTDYAPLIRTLGIDAVVNPRAITVSTILQHVRRGRIRAVYSLGEDFGEVIEAEAMDTSALIGRRLRDARLPAGVIIGAVIRNREQVIVPRGDTIIEAGDRVVLFAASKAVKRVEKMFAVRLDFF